MKEATRQRRREKGIAGKVTRVSDEQDRVEVGSADGESSGEPNEFARLGKQRQHSLVSEIVHFIVETRNWWLVPIVVVLLLVSLLVFFTSTGAAPFIYTLF